MSGLIQGFGDRCDSCFGFPVDDLWVHPRGFCFCCRNQSDIWLGFKGLGAQGVSGLIQGFGERCDSCFGFTYSAAGIRVTCGWGLRAWGLRGCLGLYRVLGKDWRCFGFPLVCVYGRNPL